MKSISVFLYALFTLVAFAQQETDESEIDVSVDASSGKPAVTLEQIIEHIGDPVPWTDGDSQALEKGEISVGYYLLGLPSRASQDYFPQLPNVALELLEPEIYEEPDQIDRSWISKEALLEYFAKKPKQELIDPQGLLSRQAYTDREAFLTYHRRDSNIPIFIYLFDGPQEVPVGYDVEGQLKSQLAGQGPALLAYYFLGRPDKSKVAMSPSLRQSLSLLEYQRILESAISEASEKSDPIDQLEGFSVQLSIRMYWIERAMREAAESEATLPGLSTVLPSIQAKNVTAKPEQKKQKVIFLLKQYRSHIAAGAIILLAGIAGWFARKLNQKKKRYYLPESDLHRRLDAPYAAGVGAVLHFRSPQIPPSSQREQVPDYIQRY